MTKKNTKYWRIIFTITMVPLLMFSVGCFQFPFFSSGNTRISLLEDKVDLLFDSMESLNTSSRDLEDKLDEIRLEKDQLSNVHVQIKDELSETKSSIIKINQKLADIYSYGATGKETSTSYAETVIKKPKKVEEEKPISKDVVKETEKIEEAVARVPVRKDIATSTKKVVDEVLMPKEVVEEVQIVDKAPPPPAKKVVVEKDEVIEDTIENRESAAKETQKKLKASLVEKLFNRAKSLYRQGKFEEAVTKWEDVLEFDPDRLDAMYNIEVAKDRIRERQSRLAE